MLATAIGLVKHGDQETNRRPEARSDKQRTNSGARKTPQSITASGTWIPRPCLPASQFDTREVTAKGSKSNS